MTETLDTRDIQALVVRGYGNLHAARFLLLQVRDGRAEQARGYLRELCARIDRASEPTGELALQIAFTARGLAALGVPERALATFSRELLEGMDDDVRAQSLGDRGDNDPSRWEWGRASSPVHAMLMLYAHDDPAFETRVEHEVAKLEAAGLHVMRQQHTTTLRDHKEHFGWRDGLSLPNIEGVPPERSRKKQQESWTRPIKPGEFVLGYHNEYDAFSESPTADPADDPADLLPATADGRKDLGRNGTYLVYRELVQDVFGLWRYLADSREPGRDPAERAIALGAKMVGRWPSGAPLVVSPERDEPAHATANTFLYSKDPAGLSCPIGAHIRRANPRDVLGSGRSTDDSSVMVRKHQMIRRGRPFGPPVSHAMDPREILAAQPDSVRRGLHFICLVGHISRQFELVQRAWIHSGNFSGLFKDGDPISAARRPPGDPNPNDEFTCPASPVRRKYKGMPQFTKLVGGAYFFLPGIAALRFIARQP